MSEVIGNYENHEKSGPDPEKLEKLSRENFERMERDAAEAEAKKDTLAAIREKLEKTALSKEKIKLDQNETRPSGLNVPIGRSLRESAVKRGTKQVQNELSGRDRAFSRVIHQPVVEALSNAAEGTVARPSGLLVGGLFSVLSSIAVLYICRHYGYQYNYLVGLACFAAGFLVGLVFEGIYKLFFKPRH
jgi:hypothetical protein